jgi:hypothetical protein
LSEDERQRLHAWISRQGMTQEEIDEEAAEIARMRDANKKEKEGR